MILSQQQTTPPRGKCCYCEELIYNNNYTKEHLVCSSHGGNNSAANKRSCCKHCNTERGSKSLEKYLELIESKLQGKVSSRNQRTKLETKKKNILKIIAYIDMNAKILYKSGRLPAKYKKEIKLPPIRPKKYESKGKRKISNI